MNIFTNIVNWFAGNGRYMTLYHCMDHDQLWIAITVLLDLSVATGYIVIAKHWSKNARLLPPSPPKRALGNIRNIFIFCGLCGYLFIPIKMFWPAWRLYDMFMVVLAYFTWRYAWNARDLKVIYAELGRSNRLAEDLETSRQESQQKSFFLNAISHDLRTPLNGLVLQASLAELSAANNDPQGLRDAVESLKASAKSAADLLDGFLNYSRVGTADDSGLVTTFPLAEILTSAVRTHEAFAAGKNLSLRVNSTDGLNIRADRSKLERILSNLIDNAIKFTDRGSVRVEVERAGSRLEIHVIDSGVGIAPEHLERLFDEFYQVGNHERDRKRGFGLGLAIARRLARQIGGDLTITSTVGAGSRFTLLLDDVVAPALHSEQPAAVRPTVSAS